MNIINTIRTKQENSKHFVWNGVEVFIKDPIKNKEVSLKAALKKIESKISTFFLSNVDVIYVGNFEFLRDRDVQAMYENSSIYITNIQEDLDDLCDDIVHEIAHSIEEQFQELIYADGRIEREFAQKRKHLYNILSSEKVENLELSDFLQTTYSEDFDKFLYDHIGYSMLNMVSSNIFYSPYAATSLREYFANGFEAFFYFDEYDFLKRSCPALFSKLDKLLEISLE